ncbi:MAG: septation ring formation regulator EzrA [Bacilli bacterium]|nr:septation ring formation regulator EzrA [Bacilli bacterium]
MDNFALIMITIFGVTAIFVVTIICIIRHFYNKKITNKIENLDIEKNTIASLPITPELAKIEAFLKNDKIEELYKNWQKRLNTIREKEIPEINDMLLDTDFTLKQRDYKNVNLKLSKLEIALYKVKSDSENLLSEIRTITSSDEKNRVIITKLKADYRELYSKFLDNKTDYRDIAPSISVQFENITKRFELFERAMEKNDYTEVTKILRIIDEMLKHMTVVLEEVPAIVLLAMDILPAKIRELKEHYKEMTDANYPLDYLNIDYNINEANKKIQDIITRCKMLNLEDSLFELKVLSDYFDSAFADLEKEKLNRESYDNINKIFVTKLNRTNKLVKDMFDKILELRQNYKLSDTDIEILSNVREDLKTLNEDYKLLLSYTGNNAFAYSQLTKEIENLIVRLERIESHLDLSMDSIGNMKEDEARAREQLEEIKIILKQSKDKIGEFNLPVIPKFYYVELNEASSAIKEIIRELDKKPITITILNTRVDTARDLSLKLLGKTKEIIKNATFAEMAIVYGNRYRTTVEGLDKNLTYAEVLFNKGEYKKSLELAINCLNRVEPGIYEKLLNLYTTNEK